MAMAEKMMPRIEMNSEQIRPARPQLKTESETFDGTRASAEAYTGEAYAGSSGATGVYIGAVGSGVYFNAIDVLSAYGLTEKDIKPQYLTCIIECMKPKYTDIMDTYNGHNKELVSKINAAWRNPKYHNMFGAILLALLKRDTKEFEDRFDCDVTLSEEYAMDNAHEIMEGVCDDLDLEMILKFIRYEE